MPSLEESIRAETGLVPIHERSENDFFFVGFPRSGHHWTQYLLAYFAMGLRPDIATRNSNFLKYANGDDAAFEMLTPAVRNDPGIYPPPPVRATLVPELAKSAQFTRFLNRMWTRFKTGE